MVILGNVGHVESRSVRLEMVLVLVQDWCTVCAKRTMGQISFRTHPMVLLGVEAQLQAHFGLFGDNANLDARWVHCAERTMGSEIILDVPDGTSR